MSERFFITHHDIQKPSQKPPEESAFLVIFVVFPESSLKTQQPHNPRSMPLFRTSNLLLQRYLAFEALHCRHSENHMSSCQLRFYFGQFKTALEIVPVRKLDFSIFFFLEKGEPEVRLTATLNNSPAHFRHLK